jgi:hypothetical protein
VTARIERSEWHKGHRRLDSNRVVRAIANQSIGMATGLDRIDWSQVAPDLAAETVPLLDAAMTAMRQVRRELRRIAAVTVTDGPPCRHCDAPVPLSASGRQPLYCSQSCRQRAYEARREMTRK